MRLAKPHPVLASFVSAAVALLPVLAMAMLELAAMPGTQSFNVPDNTELRIAGVTLIITPFLYVVAVPVCYGAGAMLLRFRLYSLGHFSLGTTVLAVLLGLVAGIGLGIPSQYGASDIAISVGACILLALLCALPAAVCWWLLAVQPHNPVARKLP